MSISTLVSFSHPSGTVVPLKDWVATLSPAEQAAFATVDAANNAFHSSIGFSADPVTGTGSCSTKPERYHTVEWKAWFDRYVTETGVQVNFSES